MSPAELLRAVDCGQAELPSDVYRADVVRACAGDLGTAVDVVEVGGSVIVTTRDGASLDELLNAALVASME